MLSSIIKLFIIYPIILLVHGNQIYTMSLQHLTYGMPNYKAVMTKQSNIVIALDFSQMPLGTPRVYQLKDNSMNIIKSFMASNELEYRRWVVGKDGNRIAFQVYDTSANNSIRLIHVYSKTSQLSTSPYYDPPIEITSTLLATYNISNSKLGGISNDGNILCFGQDNLLKLISVYPNGTIITTQLIDLIQNTSLDNFICKFSKDDKMLLVSQQELKIFTLNNMNQYVYYQSISASGIFYQHIRSVDISLDTLTIVITSSALTEIHTRTTTTSYFQTYQVIDSCSGKYQTVAIVGNASIIIQACNRRTLQIYVRTNSGYYENQQIINKTNDMYLHTNWAGDKLMVPDTNSHSILFYDLNYSAIKLEPGTPDNITPVSSQSKLYIVYIFLAIFPFITISNSNDILVACLIYYHKNKQIIPTQESINQRTPLDKNDIVDDMVSMQIVNQARVKKAKRFIQDIEISGL